MPKKKGISENQRGRSLYGFGKRYYIIVLRTKAEK
jgi:hypothetical protein